MTHVEERRWRHSAWKVTWPWAAGLAILGEVPPCVQLVAGYHPTLNPLAGLLGLGIGAAINLLFWWPVLAGAVWLVRLLLGAVR